MKIRVLLLFICILAGCNSNNNKSVENRILSDLNIKYDDAKSFFDKELVNHFPKKIDDNNITFSNGVSPEIGNLELIVINRTPNNSSELKATYREKAIAIYNAGDSCLLVVNRFATRENYYKIELSEDDKQLIELECYAPKLPVPNFWHNDYTTNETECKLPEDFTLYLLEARSGIFIADNFLTDGRFMPKKWKNGFSKGVAISEKNNTIIYWLIVW